MGTLGNPFLISSQIRVNAFFMSRLSDEYIFSSLPISIADGFDMTVQLLDHVSSVRLELP